MVQADRLSDVFQQLAFISAVLGGFSVTFWVALLTHDTEATYVPMTMLFLLGALLFFVALGLSGFVRSRRLGVVSAVLAGVGVLSLGVIVWLF